MRRLASRRRLTHRHLRKAAVVELIVQLETDLE